MPDAVAPGPHTPLLTEPPLVEVSVEIYLLGGFMVIHRIRCHCDKEYSQYRQWRTVKALHLADLLYKLRPHDFASGRTTREVCRSVAVAACNPPLPIKPYHRTLMRKQNTMGKIPVVTCPDATGKLIVHDPGCGHPARLRATSTGRGSHHQVASLAELVEGLYAPETLGFKSSGNLEEIMERDFEISDCTALPVTVPTGADDMVQKVLESYSALVALCSTAQGKDSQLTRDLAERLGRRVQLDHGLRSGVDLTAGDVRAYVITSAEASCWTTLRELAVEKLGQLPDDLDRAKVWVATAVAMVERYRKALEQADEEGGTAMGRAFNEGALAGGKQFIRNASDALNGMDGVLEELAEAQAQAEEAGFKEG